MPTILSLNTYIRGKHSVIKPPEAMVVLTTIVTVPELLVSDASAQVAGSKAAAILARAIIINLVTQNLVLASVLTPPMRQLHAARAAVGLKVKLGYF